jgi:putative ABC transport system permease protein
MHGQAPDPSILFGENESIRFPILMRIAFRNLFYKKLRTSLTVVGVVVGIGAVVFLLAFGFGLRNLVTHQVVDSNSIRTIDVSQTNAQVVHLDGNATTKIKQFNDVESVSRVFNFAGQVDYKNSKTGAVVYGTDQQFMDLSSYKLVAGPNISLGNGDNIIVNSSFLKAIGVKNPQTMVNQKIKLELQVPTDNKPAGIKGKTFDVNAKVASVVESGAGSELYINSDVFTNKGFDNASQLKVLVKNKAAVSTLEKRISSMGFTTSSPLDTVEQIDQVFGILNLLFLGFGSIGLVIAVLGMFNTLTITLLERTKEIGLMRTLGARRRDVRRLFIIESIGLSFIGGMLGIFAAWVLSRGVNSFLNHLANSRGLGEKISVFSFRLSLIIEVAVFSALLGLFVVYLPARRAAKVSPIEALRG